jgi:hypothetical protein
MEQEWIVGISLSWLGSLLAEPALQEGCLSLKHLRQAKCLIALSI